jgi:hypothetical protein
LAPTTNRKLTTRFWPARAAVASSLNYCAKSLDGSEARPFKFGANSPERKNNELDCNFTCCKTGMRPRSAPARREEMSSKFSLLPEQTGATGSGPFMELEA